MKAEPEFKQYNAEQIRNAVDRGAIVYADSEFYMVIKDRANQYLIVGSNGYTVGLTWKDGVTLNATTFWIKEE